CPVVRGLQHILSVYITLILLPVTEISQIKFVSRGVRNRIDRNRGFMWNLCGNGRLRGQRGRYHDRWTDEPCSGSCGVVCHRRRGHTGARGGLRICLRMRCEQSHCAPVGTHSFPPPRSRARCCSPCSPPRRRGRTAARAGNRAAIPAGPAGAASPATPAPNAPPPPSSPPPAAAGAPPAPARGGAGAPPPRGPA